TTATINPTYAPQKQKHDTTKDQKPQKPTKTKNKHPQKKKKKKNHDSYSSDRPSDPISRRARGIPKLAGSKRTEFNFHLPPRKFRCVWKFTR
ncbi:MAG: hypothetical protein ACFCD0_24830, partial [Gemmataceae bacterium]